MFQSGFPGEYLDVGWIGGEDDVKTTFLEVLNLAKHCRALFVEIVFL